MPFPEADEALERCLESFKGQYDELVLVVNDGMGYGPAANLGLKWASGDYLIVSNNDIELKRGTLRDLPWDGGFSVPLIEPEPKDYKPRAIFCMPKWAYMLLCLDGYFYDPRFEIGYYEDDDIIRRLQDIPVRTEERILVNHLRGGGLSMKTMGEQKFYDINHKKYLEKWT